METLLVVLLVLRTRLDCTAWARQGRGVATCTDHTAILHCLLPRRGVLVPKVIGMPTAPVFFRNRAYYWCIVKRTCVGWYNTIYIARSISHYQTQVYYVILPLPQKDFYDQLQPSNLTLTAGIRTHIHNKVPSFISKVLGYNIFYFQKFHFMA